MVDLSNENEEKKKKESSKHKQWKIFGFLYSIYFSKFIPVFCFVVGRREEVEKILR